ncbi:40S ribosomal protein S12-like [Varroa jacobsoni]|uniref:40S ribosomal protein S12 n=1 Tax=Varroa destructor TaxID=109461 RepID=A0A7M7K122_VARDE|nr:40S ribosomal protein S12-like [Varroa destructor]XP_022687640.1 40S ribosomal protein S12-like [Varroa jacobsoni]
MEPVEQMDVTQALQEVLRIANHRRGLAKGLHEVAKVLGEGKAHLCVLAQNCDESMYRKLVEALCAERGIRLFQVDSNKKLGEWVGLCKFDKEGKARKVVGCSCIAVKEYGEETQAHDILTEYFRKQKS